MMDYEQPAIQNATGVCFYCTGKLADVTPTETWEVYPDQCFVKVQCSNQDCAGIAWRPAQAAQDKKPVLKNNASYEDALTAPAKRSVPAK
jgi:hypothetical protein